MARQYESTDVRRRQIADAALDVIAEDGLRSFTTRAIAARVGITDGTIFRHFRNKEGIVLAAMERLEEMLFERFDLYPTDPLQRLEFHFRQRTRLLCCPRPAGRLVYSEQLIHAAGPEGREKVRAWREKSETLMREALYELARQGRLRTDIEPERLVAVLRGLLMTLFFERTLSDCDMPDLDSRVDELWGTFVTVVNPPLSGTES